MEAKWEQRAKVYSSGQDIVIISNAVLQISLYTAFHCKHVEMPDLHWEHFLRMDQCCTTN